jgi:hypothetical protein
VARLQFSAWRFGRVGAALAVVCAASVPIACGGQPVEVSPAPPRHTTPPDEPLTGRAGTARRVELTVTEAAPGRFRYRAPRAVHAGLVEIALRNDGEVPHKAQLWKVTGGHAFRAALVTRRPLPGWLQTAGGVARTEPGATGTSVQNLAPGRYYVAGEGNERGTVAQLRVTGHAASGPLPRAAARLDVREYTFATSGLRAGRRAVAFRNTGAELHHVFFARMQPGASLDDVRRFFTAKNYVGTPPVDDGGTRETVVLDGGQSQDTELDLRSGRYALVCFVRNRAGGPQHVKLGMLDELTVP